jgi:hypothetical protein
MGARPLAAPGGAFVNPGPASAGGPGGAEPIPGPPND